jgi:4-amino-4-deoxy-L-arabinose transferase-like glycosyltransferase
MKKILNIFSEHYVLILIILIAAFFRLYKLDQIPPGPSLDEVSIGWNAYSVLKTGADEYGNKFPLILRAYDDWRPALYVYTVIPFIEIFGLTAAAVRIPSVLLSLVLVYISYFIGVNLWDLIRRKPDKTSQTAGYLTAFFVAISPWQIYLSRLGHEANLGLLFTALGTHFLFLNLKNNTFKTVLFSAVFYILAMYSYQSEKLIVPVIIFLSGLIYLRHWMSYGRKILWLGALFVILVIPLILMTFTGSGLIRLSGTSAFFTDQEIYREASLNNLTAVNRGDLIGRIINSKKATDFRVFSANYISHLNPKWLFTGEGNESHKVPFMGLMFYWELPLVLTGLLVLFKSSGNKAALLLLGIILTSPLPGSITTQAPHAMRSYTFIPLIQFTGAVGLIFIGSQIKTKPVKIAGIMLFAVLVLAGLRQLWYGYFMVFPVTHSKSFQSSIIPAIVYANSETNNFDRIVFSNRDNLSQSYMFYLFNTKFDPLIYRTSGGTGSGGFAEPHKIGKFEFRPVNLSVEKPDAKTLYVINNTEAEGKIGITRIFTNPDGSGMIIAGHAAE